MKKIAFLFFTFLATHAYADTSVSMQLLSEDNKPIGDVLFKDSKYGLLIIPHLYSLPPGLHGFHIHEKPSCANAGMAALGHLDPKKTNHHLGPYDDVGHLGDLPVLYVDAEGNANTPVVAPRLKLSLIKNHALMIHQGADNYTDTPPMGGGGTRYACGIIQ